jgi:hypothetical protein
MNIRLTGYATSGFSSPVIDFYGSLTTKDLVSFLGDFEEWFIVDHFILSSPFGTAFYSGRTVRVMDFFLDKVLEAVDSVAVS